MKKKFLILTILSTIVLFSGCSKEEAKENMKKINSKTQSLNDSLAKKVGNLNTVIDRDTKQIKSLAKDAKRIIERDMKKASKDINKELTK